MPNQHQNDPKMYLSYKIQHFSAHARELCSGYKSAFPVPPARGLVVVSTRRIHFSLGRSPNEYANLRLDARNRYRKVQVGKDQEKAQSEKDSHSKNRGGKKPN